VPVDTGVTDNVAYKKPVGNAIYQNIISEKKQA
jgi:hypothetical protein